MRSLLLSLLFLIGCGNGWRTRDTLLEGAAEVTLAADWGQSRHIVASCDEANPIIGHCGERMGVTAWFLEFMTLHVIVAAILPPGAWRTTWQALVVGAETNEVWSNWSDGVRPW